MTSGARPRGAVRCGALVSMAVLLGIPVDYWGQPVSTEFVALNVIPEYPYRLVKETKYIHIVNCARKPYCRRPAINCMQVIAIYIRYSSRNFIGMLSFRENNFPESRIRRRWNNRWEDCAYHSSAPPRSGSRRSFAEVY